MMKHYYWNSSREWLSSHIEKMDKEELKSEIRSLAEKVSDEGISEKFSSDMKCSDYKEHRLSNETTTAKEWLLSFIENLPLEFDLREVLISLHDLLSTDMIEVEYKVEMEKAGFLDTAKMINKESLTVGSIVVTYSEMSFFIVQGEDGSQFQTIDLTNLRNSKLNAPKFESLNDIYDWFQATEDDGIKSIIPVLSLQSTLKEMLEFSANQ